MHDPMRKWIEHMIREMGMNMDVEGSNPNDVRIHYRFSSIIEFYSQALNVSPDGNPESHEIYRRMKEEEEEEEERRWEWTGLENWGSLKDTNAAIEEIMKRRFTYRKGIQQLQKEAQSMVQGFKRKVYKWNELDGDDLSMERLRDHLPAMRKRTYDQGNKFGNFISLCFMGGVTANVSSERMRIKTGTAIKLINFFESIGKRVEVILFYKSSYSGQWRNKQVNPLVIEILVKRFTDPMNIGLINTALSPWTFRYWKFLFMDAKFHGDSGRGFSKDITEEDITFRKGSHPIIINTYDCLSQEESDQFIKNVLNNYEASNIQK